MRSVRSIDKMGWEKERTLLTWKDQQELTLKFAQKNGTKLREGVYLLSEEMKHAGGMLVDHLVSESVRETDEAIQNMMKPLEI